MKYEIGARLRKHRLQRGLTQKEFAAQIGVSNSRVSNWEHGINRPDADMLPAICRVLQVSPSDLLDIHLDIDELNEKERRVLTAYRQKPHLHEAVDLLLGTQ